MTNCVVVNALEVETIGKYIIECYVSNDFPEYQFIFFENRRDYKDIHRTGIYTDGNLKIFFKIIQRCNEVDEISIVNKLGSAFSIAKKIFELDFEDKILLMYEYLDTIKLNAYNYLRSSEYSMQEKEKLTFNFFDNLFEYTKNDERTNVLDGLCKSDMFFFGRIGEGSRSNDYYGKDFSLLKVDIANEIPSFSSKFDFILQMVKKVSCEKPKTMLSYCHGDFHDFNFSLKGIFWDVDTFGYNPVLNDFAIFYWHFYGREDFLIHKYNPWLSIYMYNQLSNKNLIKIRNLKKEVILVWNQKLFEQFSRYGIDYDSLFSEFLFKLFCRVFLVDNILIFDVEDRRRIYSYFSKIVSKIGSPMEKILFDSNDDIGFFR